MVWTGTGCTITIVDDSDPEDVKTVEILIDSDPAYTDVGTTAITSLISEDTPQSDFYFTISPTGTGSLTTSGTGTGSLTF